MRTLLVFVHTVASCVAAAMDKIKSFVKGELRNQITRSSLQRDKAYDDEELQRKMAMRTYRALLDNAADQRKAKIKKANASAEKASQSLDKILEGEK